MRLSGVKCSYDQKIPGERNKKEKKGKQTKRVIRGIRGKVEKKRRSESILRGSIRGVGMKLPIY